MGEKTPSEWRQMALEAKALAATAHDIDVRRTLIVIADSYDKLAELTEKYALPPSR